MYRRVLILSIVAALTLTSASSVGRPQEGYGLQKQRMFGRGHPFITRDLPRGRLRSKIESLRGPAADRAREWLHRFEFPENDLEAMIVDDEGGVLYVDQAPVLLPENAAQSPAGAPPMQGPTAAEDAFQLHSRPGSSRVVYLDFDGHTFSGTAWGSGTIQAAAFDLDGSPGTFSAAEKNAIAEIWHRMAEDFAPFAIDVTTEEPADFDRYTGRVLITSNTQTNGTAMPYNTAGGVAYVDVFGRSNYATYYSPALVYYNRLANNPTYIAEASAHEFGHNLGLSHDGTGSNSYYAGHGSGATSWAPIMGNSYSKNVTQWSRGEYQGANNTQDDIDIITSKLVLVADDHGNTLAQATPLAADADGQIPVSNPEIDPYNDYPENKGVIETSTDQDIFYFLSGGGQIDLTVIPAWDAFYRGSRRGANLDVQVSLLDASGASLMTSDPSTETHANIASNLGAGTYYLVISGIGNGNYSDYASAGQYFISGTLPVTATNELPDANFTYHCNDLSCSFSDSSSDADGTITAWHWDFGDGNNSSNQNPSHAYGSAGSYAVSLRVTDDANATDVVIKNVVVTSQDVTPPMVTILEKDITQEATALLTPVTLGTVTTNEGTLSNDAPAGGFPLGVTTVTWSATDSAGNTGTDTQQVSIVDTTPPQITAPSDITTTPNGNIGTATASDIFPVTITSDAPASFPVGSTLVTWTAVDSSGNSATDTQTVTVQGTPQPPPSSGIDFNDYPVSSFATQDRSGTTTIEDSGATLRLTGNNWKRIDFPYTVGPNTVIEFDFSSGTEGEIHGVGLENDNGLTSTRIFKVHGTQSWGIRDFDNYSGNGWTHHSIPVGQYYTGNTVYLVLVMDNDATATGESRFRNVSVHEE